MSVLTVNPEEISTGTLHSYLLGAVAPRPIAFASTVDAQGNINLSPFSYFNCFGANPPILIFSPARRGRDNTTKHTYENVKEVPEVVINMVSYSMVEQMSLASTEYDKGINEFVKAGLTAVDSEIVAPPRVGESLVAFECKVIEVKETGEEGGAGNLVICEVVRIHIHEEVLDESGQIDPLRLDAVGRMGGNWYCRAQGDSLFEIPKPLRTLGMGIDQLPAAIRNSEVLTGNNLARLANVERIPDKKPLPEPEATFVREAIDRRAVHAFAQKLLAEGDTELAWQVLLDRAESDG